MLLGGGIEWGSMFQHPRTRLCQTRVQKLTLWKEESGAELFEAALVLPILLMLLLGIVTFGRAYNEYQTITRAAREGAREAVLTPCATCSGVNYAASDIRTDFIEPALKNINLDPTKMSNFQAIYVALDPNDATPYICGVQISFQYPYTFSLPFTSLNLSTINLSTKVQMRLENQPTDCQSVVGQPY
jgi:Flp pilus assembly protein TadG